MAVASARFYDPDGVEFGIPTYPVRLAPDGLATRRQLRQRGRRPGGQEVAAQIMWHSYTRARGRFIRVAYLYRIDLALPVRPMTPAKWAALDKANTARRTCPDCEQDVGYVIAASLGACVTCADAFDRAA